MVLPLEKVTNKSSHIFFHVNIIVTTHGVDGEKALIDVINITNNAFIYTSSLVEKHCSFEELN